MDRPKVGVGVIIVKNNNVLLLNRKGAHGVGTWSFPGGHLEFGESEEDCARRETLEEVGVKIKNIKSVAYTNDIFESEGKHYITLFVSAEIESGTPKICEPEKCSEMNWFSIDNLPSPLFLPIQNLLNKGFKL
ncbi:MAG: NUDIX hydrolase [Nanoarchaeota archaeon]